MKTGSLLVILAIVLGVLGAGLSYSGYNESLRVSTATSTQSYTITSTKIIASTRTETVVITTSSTLSILDQVLDIPGTKGTIYAGYYDYVSSTLDAGKVNVSYHSVGGPVDFWMLSEDGFKAFEVRHRPDPGVPYIVEKLRAVSYKFTKEIPTSATCYFVFLNQGSGPVSITLHVDGGMQTEVLASTKEHVDYLTEATPFMTETVSFGTHAVGLGLLFYSGIGLVVVAGIVLAVSRMKGAAPRPAQPSPVTPVAVTAPVVSPPPSEMAREKSCINCGAPLPAQAIFCNKCGTKQ